MKFLFVVSCLLLSLSARANGCSSDASNALEIPFDSGALWRLCWHIDDHSGLVLSDVFYGARSQPVIRILDTASVAQLLFKYDEDTDPTHLVSESGLGGAHYKIPSADDCHSGVLLTHSDNHEVCFITRHRNLMTKVRGGDSHSRFEALLESWSKVGGSVFKQAWNLSEDGEITPSISYAGRLSRFTSDARFGVPVQEQLPLAATATILVNWRLDFNINGTPDNDLVDEIEFIPGISNTATRAMQVTPLRQETARTVLRENFRGWRISDEIYSSGTNTNITRIGYYLDPRTSGYAVNDKLTSWSPFDFSVTKKNPCEYLASGNQSLYPDCDNDLSEYVNEESLDQKDPVVWFSVARHFVPDENDYPVINDLDISFTLVPFDWSAFSPFSPPDSSQATVLEDERQ